MTIFYLITLHSITFDTTSAKFSSSSPSAAVATGNTAVPQQWVDSLVHTSQLEGYGHSLGQPSRSSDNNHHHWHKIPLILPTEAQASESICKMEYSKIRQGEVQNDEKSICLLKDK